MFAQYYPDYKSSNILIHLRNKLYTEPAKCLILKFYELTKIFKQTVTQHKFIKQNSNTENENQSNKELRQFYQIFIQFKMIKEDQIKKFNQVEYYMYEQTQYLFKDIKIKQITQNQQNIFQVLISKITKLFNYSQDNEQQTKQLSDTGTSTSKNIFINPQKSPKNQNIISVKIVTIQQCQQIWQNTLKYYQQHRIDDAFKEAQKYQNYIYMNNKNHKIQEDKLKLIQTIYKQYQTVSQFYNHFYDTGYIFDKQSNGIKLWYKIIGNKDVAIKVQSQLDITIQNFLCIASQIDLFEDYIPFNFQTKQLKSISRNQKIGTSKIYIPLLTDRQTYFYAAAYDRLRTKGSIFFFSKTINQDKQYQQKYQFYVPLQSQYLRLQYKYYILEYIPISTKRGKIRMVSSIDLKMDFLPLFVINKSARIFSFDYMRNYQKINQKMKGSKWDQVKKIKKNTYDFFKQKIEQYIKQKQINNYKILEKQ